MSERGAMDTDVFDVFHVSSYTFLIVNRGGVYGNTIDSQEEATGVFKLRDGMVMINNQESRQSDATLHVRPDESFIATVNRNMVGHGIRKDGQDYEIIAQTGGDNFETGLREHYRVTLQRTDYSEYMETS